MRWTRWTISLSLCAVFLLGAVSGHASITLKISATNSSSLGAREIPLKSYLPKGVALEDVISAGGLEVSYDAERDRCYLHKKVLLEAQESVIYDVEIEDVWVIDQRELDALDEKTQELVGKLQGTGYAEVALQTQESIRERIQDILTKQAEADVDKVGATGHIAVYNLNRDTVARIQSSINDLERLVSVVEEGRVASEDVDQKKAQELLDAQRIKEQMLNYGDPDVPVTCLVEEALENETQDILFESPETVSMRISVKNPSVTKARSVPLRYFLAKGIYSSDVIDAQGFKTGYDFGKSLFYVYDDDLALEPGETKTFNVVLSNKWAIDKKKLYGLKVYLQGLIRATENRIGLETATKFGKENVGQIYRLLLQSGPTELSQNTVASYKKDVLTLENLRQNVQRMEDFLLEAKMSPEVMVMEQEQFCRDMKSAKEGSKDTWGSPDSFSVRRLKLLVGTVFKGRSVSTANTWKIIWYIIIFLGVVSGVFYFINIRQQQSTMFDPLTGAFSRAYAMDRFREELKIAKGNGTRCSLLMMDCDKFKGINDTHGHAAGDLILKEFVLAMRKGIRATDILGRFGGDEFMIILPTGEKETALKIAQSIARIVEGTAVKVNPQLTLNITCSIGVATFPDDSQTPEDLFEKADQALYQIKRKGGNGAAAYGLDV